MPPALPVTAETFRAAELLRRGQYTRSRLAGLGGLAGRISGQVRGAEVGDDGEKGGDGGHEDEMHGDGGDEEDGGLSLGQALVVSACSRLGRALSSPASRPGSVDEAEADMAVDLVASRPSPWARLGEDLRLCLAAPCMAGVTGPFVGAALLRAMVFYCSDVEFCAAIDAVYAASGGSGAGSGDEGRQADANSPHIGTVLLALGVQPGLIEAVVLHESRQVFNACSSTVHDADSLLGAQGMLNQLPCRPASVAGENALYDLCLLLAQMGVDCVPLRVRLQHPLDTCDAILTAQPLLSASLDGFRDEGDLDGRPLGVRLTRLLVALPWTDRGRDGKGGGGAEYAPLASELRVMYLLHAMRGADLQMAEAARGDWDDDADDARQRGREGSPDGVGVVSLLAKQVAALLSVPDAACSPALQAALGRLLPPAAAETEAEESMRGGELRGLHDAALRAVESALARFPTIARAQGPGAGGECSELSRLLIESAPPERLLALLPLLMSAAPVSAGSSHPSPSMGLGGGGGEGHVNAWREPWPAVAEPLLRFLLPLLYAPHDRLVAHLWRGVGADEGRTAVMFAGQLGLCSVSESESALVAACLSPPAARYSQGGSTAPNTALVGLLAAALAELRSLRGVLARRGGAAESSAGPAGGFSTGIDEALVAQLMHKVGTGRDGMCCRAVIRHVFKSLSISCCLSLTLAALFSPTIQGFMRNGAKRAVVATAPPRAGLGDADRAESLARALQWAIGHCQDEGDFPLSQPPHLHNLSIHF